MPITKKPRQRHNPELFVYYNDWTGKIFSIGTTARNTPAPFIKTHSRVAADIVAGKRSLGDYVVSSDYQKQEIVKKSDVVQMRQKEDTLFLVPRSRMELWDIRFKIFTQSKTLIVEFNPVKLAKLVSHNMREQITVSNSVVFEFHIVKRDQPDFFIDTIRVDAEKLIQNPYLAFDISGIIKYTDINDFDILTRRHFENYYMQIVQDRFFDVAASRNTFENIWHHAKTDQLSHIEMTQEGDILEVKSLVDADDFNELNIHKKNLQMYVVGDTPDQLIDAFTVDISKIRMGEVERYQIDFDLDEVNLMYHSPALKINKVKIDDIDAN